MYTIIGGDGKEYGPVSAEQVKAWIGAGRANLDTHAKALGSDAWKRLADYPEFGASGGFAPPTLGTAPIGEAALIAGELKSRAVLLDVSRCFERSWELLKGNFWQLVGVTALVIALDEVAGYAIQKVAGPYAGALLSIVIGIVFIAGLQFYFLKKIRGQSAGVADAFSGFTLAFGPLVLGGLVFTLILCLGFVCFILPAIYLGVAYSFAWLLVMDQKLDFWTALEVSRRVVTAQWWRVLGLGLLSVVFLLLGAALLGVGIFVALPLMYGALVYAYEDLCAPPKMT
jgi:hypothetical protein